MKSYIKQGDCLELMKEIPDGSVDLILCDPPYGTTAYKWDGVLDNCMGSGSTGVAVKRVGGRHFIGIEQNKVYFEIAQKRIKEEE
jgi:DNA modification methylase